MNGNERLWWVQKPSGEVYLSSPESPLPADCMRFSTTTPSEMDRIFKKIDQQEKEANEKLIEGIYTRGAVVVNALRDKLNTRLRTAGVGEFEKALIRMALRRMDERDAKMQENHAYGVSEMQTTPANPSAPGENRVTFLPKEMVH